MITHNTKLVVKPGIEYHYDEDIDIVYCPPESEIEWVVKLNALSLEDAMRQGNTGTLADTKFLSEIEGYKEIDKFYLEED